jgi:hypothetical protein
VSHIREIPPYIRSMPRIEHAEIEIFNFLLQCESAVGESKASVRL